MVDFINPTNGNFCPAFVQPYNRIGKVLHFPLATILLFRAYSFCQEYQVPSLRRLLNEEVVALPNFGLVVDVFFRTSSTNAPLDYLQHFTYLGNIPLFLEFCAFGTV